MRLLVCGGRDFGFWAGDDEESYLRYIAEERWILMHLNRKWQLHENLFIISGGARGVDTVAEDWANDNEIPIAVFHADWPRYGNGAGPIRNQQMLDEGQPNMVLAFNGGNGTEDMVRRAVRQGVPVERAIL